MSSTLLHSSLLRRGAAVLGLAVVGGLGTFAIAAPAGATGTCPWYNPLCNGTPTVPTLPPVTVPPVVADPPPGVADPNAGDPPASPPEATPEDANDAPPQANPTGGRPGAAPQATPAGTPDDASAATETAVERDAESDEGGSSALPIVAGVGALAAASGAGIYLYRTRRA